MFYACFPQLLGGTMILQLESDGRFVLLELTRPNLDVEVVTFVRDF